MAPREPTWKTRSRSCDGHDRTFGQRMSTSVSFSGANGVPQEGTGWAWMKSPFGAVAFLDHRTQDLGDDVTGLAQEHQVPMSTPLRFTSSALCSVAIDTVGRRPALVP